jgi:hypothetical protein
MRLRLTCLVSADVPFDLGDERPQRRPDPAGLLDPRVVPDPWNAMEPPIPDALCNLPEAFLAFG